MNEAEQPDPTQQPKHDIPIQKLVTPLENLVASIKVYAKSVSPQITVSAPDAAVQKNAAPDAASGSAAPDAASDRLAKLEADRLEADRLNKEAPQVAAAQAGQAAQAEERLAEEERLKKEAAGSAAQAASGSAPDAAAQAEAERLKAKEASGSAPDEEAKLNAQEAAPQAAYKLDMNLKFKTPNGAPISLEKILNMLKNANKCQLSKQECDAAFNEINNATSEQEVKNIIGKLKIYQNSIQNGGTRKPRMHRRKKTQRKRSKTIKKKIRAGKRK